MMDWVEIEGSGLRVDVERLMMLIHDDLKRCYYRYQNIYRESPKEIRFTGLHDARFMGVRINAH